MNPKTKRNCVHSSPGEHTYNKFSKSKQILGLWWGETMKNRGKCLSKIRQKAFVWNSPSGITLLT